MISTKEDIVEMLVLQKETLRSYCVQRIGLFGSFVKHTNTKTSDVDLLVEFEPGKKTFSNYTGAYLFLKKILKREIDFLTPESVSPYIGQHILNEVEYVVID